MLDREGIHAVILDIRMPGRSGLELLALLREDPRWRDVPAVLLTGAQLTQDELAVVARQKAFVFYKPKSYEALTGYLDRVTRRRRNR